MIVVRERYRRSRPQRGIEVRMRRDILRQIGVEIDNHRTLWLQHQLHSASFLIAMMPLEMGQEAAVKEDAVAIEAQQIVKVLVFGEDEE